jgi:DNA processing protein
LAATPYPPEHGGLYEAIVDAGGLLLSEFPSHWPVLAANFPRRNRIIAGLSVAVVVIEASVGSGALITARHAHDDQGRPVFALPGPVDSVRSEGCNRAIRDHLATLTLDPSEVVDELRSMGVLLAAGARMAAAQGHRQPVAGLPAVIQEALPAVRQLLRKEPNADCTRVAEVTGLDARFSQVALTLHQLEVPDREKH